MIHSGHGASRRRSDNAQILLIAALIGVVAVGALFLTGVLPQMSRSPHPTDHRAGTRARAG